MPGVSEEQQLFETLRPDLVRSDPGRFAVVCGQRLLGVYDSVDDALSASSVAFDAGALPEGAPLLISEIAERVSVRVTGHPAARGGADGGMSGPFGAPA